MYFTLAPIINCDITESNNFVLYYFQKFHASFFGVLENIRGFIFREFFLKKVILRGALLNVFIFQSCLVSFLGPHLFIN